LYTCLINKVNMTLATQVQQIGKFKKDVNNLK
jgi:hypothetical protein